MAAPAYGSSARTAATITGTLAASVAPSTAANNIVICWLQAVAATLPGTTVTSVPSGFSLMPGFTSAGVAIQGATGQSTILWGYWKRAEGADAGTYSWGFSESTSYKAAFVARYTGCVTTGIPFDTAYSTNTNDASLTCPAVSLTTIAPDELLLYTAASYSGYRVTTQPSGFTSNAQGVTGDSDCGWQLSSKTAASPAATGSLTGTWNGSHYGTTAVWLGALLSTAPKTETLNDDFTSQDDAKWDYASTFGGGTVSGGQLHVIIDAELSSNVVYSLTGSYAYVELPSGVDGAVMAVMDGFGGSNGGIFFSLDGIDLSWATADFATVTGSATYDPVAHRWLQIRESGGTLYFEASATGSPGSWSTLGSGAFGSTGVVVGLSGGVFANFNTPPSAPPAPPLWLPTGMVRI